MFKFHCQVFVQDSESAGFRLLVTGSSLDRAHSSSVVQSTTRDTEDPGLGWNPALGKLLSLVTRPMSQQRLRSLRLMLTFAAKKLSTGANG